MSYTNKKMAAKRVVAYLRADQKNKLIKRADYEGISVSRYIEMAVELQLKSSKSIFQPINKTETMKLNLRTFDASNMATQRKGDACISFSRNAANSISKAAAARMALSGGDKIAICQDEDNPDDWYLVLSETGFGLRDDKGTGCLFFNNVAISNAILDYLEIEGDRASFLIVAEYTENEDEPGVQYWPLLTSKPIIKTRKKRK